MAKSAPTHPPESFETKHGGFGMFFGEIFVVTSKRDVVQQNVSSYQMTY